SIFHPRSRKQPDVADLVTDLDLDMTVLDAVRRELDVMEARRPGISSSVEAALALELAAEVGEAGAPLRDRVTAARALSEVLAALREPAPEREDADRLDELSQRREPRRAKVAASS